MTRGAYARPVRATTPEQKLVAALAQGLADRHIDADAIARMLVLLPTASQVELGNIVYNLIGHWAQLADVYPPEYPNYNNLQAAKRIITTLAGQNAR